MDHVNGFDSKEKDEIVQIPYYYNHSINIPYKVCYHLLLYILPARVRITMVSCLSSNVNELHFGLSIHLIFAPDH